MKETQSMMSYKAWRTINQKLINESALGTTTLGLRTPASLGITGSKLAEMGFPPPEDEDDMMGHDDGTEPDELGDDADGDGADVGGDDDLNGMDDPDMLALLGGDDDEEGQGDDEVAPEGDDADALGDDSGMGGMGGEGDEDEFSFDPSDLGDDAGMVPDHGKSADLSNLLGGMGVSPDDQAPDMGMGDDGDDGADISSLFGGAGGGMGDDMGGDDANPFGGDDDDSAPEGEADDTNIDDELDDDMQDDDDADSGGDEESEDKNDKKFMGKGWCGKMMKKEGKEFPAFMKKGKDKGKDKKEDKGNPFAKKGKDKKEDKGNPFAKKGEKKDDKKGGKPFELFKKKVEKKKTKDEEKVEENSFFSSLAKQASGSVRRIKEDSLVSTPKAKKEAGPGEIGYAPSGRVGEIPSVSAYNEWKQKNFPKKK